MAKDVITRFKLETTAFDSKIKEAAKGLADYGKTATAAGKDFDKFTKSNVEAAKSLGSIASSSTNTKDKVKELVGAYNEAAKAYNVLNKEQQQSDWAKALASSLTQLQVRIKDAKDELYNFGDAADQVKSKTSGLFGEGGFTGMLQVAGGNLLASGIQKLGAEMIDTIQQSVELAKAGEGVRNAFERLNKPELLDNLKEATHGTVSELELMKAAVKFDDFKLPIEQLGTLLAFAQKKAKDTGQSVDYMVDSIVTGLGRKSLMILDNLGLSAAQIKEEMSKAGDMTTAVANIIREEMAKAGDYVETAADRAARAAADATNEMERLGREAQPFAEAWAGVWNEIKIGGMDLLTTVFGPLADSARQIRQLLGGSAEDILTKNLPQVGSNVDDKGNYIKRPAQKGAGGFDWEKGTWKQGFSGAIYNAQTGQTELPGIVVSGTTPKKSTKRTGGGKTTTTTGIKDEFTEMEELVGLIPVAEQKVKDLQQQIRESWDEGEIATLRKELNEAQNELDVLQGKLPRDSVVELTITANTSEALQKVKEIDGVTIDPKTMTVTVNTSEALQKVQELVADVGGKVVNVKVVPVLTDADIDKQLQKQYGKAIQVPITPKLTTGEELVQSIRIKLADQNMDADIQTLRTLLETQIKYGLDSIDIPSDTLINAIIGEGLNIPDEYWEKLQSQINDKLKEMGIDELNIDFNSGEDRGKEKKERGTLEGSKQLVSGLTQVAGGLQQMGITIPEEVTQILNVVQGLMTVIEGVNLVIGVTQTAALTANTTAMIALTSALWANTFTPSLFANGGTVPHAANGYFIPGSRFSGDTTPIMANAGELVLNKAQQGNLASQLNGNGLGNLHLETYLDGRAIRIVLNNDSQSRMKGKYVTSRNYRG